MSYYQTQEMDDGEAAVIGQWDEAAPTRTRRPPLIGNQQRPYLNRPPSGAAPAGQVNNAFERVAADVRALASQVKDLETKVDTVNARHSKALTAVRGDLQQTKMLAAILPMLSKPAVKQFDSDIKGTDAANNPVTIFSKGERIVEASDDTLTTLLPMLLLAGPGLSGTPSNGSAEGAQQDPMGGNMMFLLMMVMLMGKRT